VGYPQIVELARQQRPQKPVGSNLLTSQMTEPQFHQSVTGQDIDARLWQDPFAAIAKTSEKAPPGDSENCGVNAGSAAPAAPSAHCVSPLAQADEETRQKTLMIAVTMPGAPYAKDGEVPAADALCPVE
jgi:hypothetical protein